MSFGPVGRHARHGFGRAGRTGLSAFSAPSADDVRGGPISLSISEKAAARAKRNASLYNYDAPRGGVEKSEGAPLSQSDSAKKFISAKDGADEIKKEKEKMKEEKKGAPSVTEVRKHIKYLVLEHEKKEQAANATTYALIKKDVGEEGKDPFASLPIENWDAPTPQDIYGAVGVKKNKKKLGGRVGYKRRDR